MAAYVHRTTLRFRDTDAAGIIYFANYFTLAHEALEACMVHYGIGVGRVIREKEYILPLVHADGDFAAPLRADDEVEIAVTVITIGRTSFTVEYAMRKADGTHVCEAHTVHVALNRKEHKAMPIPEEVRVVLEQLAP